MTTVITREMGFTHRQLRRVLSDAARGRPCHVGDDKVVIDAGNGGTITVTFEPESVRKIASISLPLTVVHFELSGFNDAGVETEMDMLATHFHKGGG